MARVDREQVLAALVDERFGPPPLRRARPPAPHRLSTPDDAVPEDPQIAEALDGDDG